jgi:hypothetical protein
MPNPRSFGRRIQTRQPGTISSGAISPGTISSGPIARPPAPDPIAGEPVLAAAAADANPPEIAPDDDNELQAWKSARRKATHLPWRQIAVVAGLSFAVASFVLPEALNDALQWPLSALVAISLYMGWRNRKQAAS